MSVGATGPYAPSPMPTKQRVASNRPNAVASPLAPLATLHKTTPMAISTQRENRSASHPNTGADSMYVTMNAVANSPILALASGSPGARSVSRISGSTAARM